MKRYRLGPLVALIKGDLLTWIVLGLITLVIWLITLLF